MNVLCTATNATVAGVRVPVGEYSIPWSGQITVQISGVSSVVAGSGHDTLVLEDSGPTVWSGGIGAFEALTAGFCLVFAGVIVTGLARKWGRWLVGGAVEVD